MSTSSSQLLADVAQLHTDSGLMHSVIHGDPTTSVMTDGGPIKSVAAAVASIQTFTARGQWVASTAYAFKDVYTDSGIAYMVMQAHTSTTISADLAAGKVAVYQGIPPSEFSSRIGRVVDSVSALKGLSLLTYTHVFVTGYYAAGDGGGGAYYYDPSDVTSADNGGTIIVASDAGRWKLQYTGPLSVCQFGAREGATVSATSGFLRAANAVSALGGGRISIPAGKYLIDGSPTFPPNVTFVGSMGNPGERTSDFSYNSDSCIVVDVTSSATISLGSNTGFDGCVFIRNGLTLPFADTTTAASGVTAFAGTALTGVGADYFVKNCLILGFGTAIYSTGVERPYIENVRFDCTNGIDIQNCADIAKVNRCHGWPFTTVHQSFTTDPLLVRTGFGFRFRSMGDWNKHTECFTYGYFRGFWYEDVNSVTSVGCGSDYTPSQNNSQIGVYMVGTSLALNLIGYQGAAQDMAVYIGTTNASGIQGQGVNIIGGTIWGAKTYGVRVETGRALVNKMRLYGMPTGYGISLGANAILSGPSTIEGIEFDAVTTPFDVNSASLDRHNISKNTYIHTTDSTVGERRVYDNTLAQRFHYKYVGDSTGVVDRYRKARGSGSSPAVVQSGDSLAMFQADSYDGSAFGASAQLRAAAAGTPSAGNTPGRWVFSTNQGSGILDRCLLDETGVMRPVTDNAYTFGSAAARWSTIFAATGTINTSDADTKTDIAEGSLGLDFINALRPVSYKFKVGGVEVVRQVYRDTNGNECTPDAEGAVPAEIITQERPGERTHWGLIAQEVKAAADAAGVDFAGWTIEDKNDPDSLQGLRYDQFICPIIKAMQEIAARLKKLEDGN